MATYAIGDIQGCFDSFERLLDVIAFDATRDRVWLVGDLVNRGPKSLAMLRWAQRHRDRVEAVLGNHDLHLIGRHLGVVSAKRRDTVDDVLAAPDREELIDWLRSLSLVHHGDGHLLVHAALPRKCSAAEAQALGDEVRQEIAGPRVAELLTASARAMPIAWHAKLRGKERTIALLQIFTRVRVCRSDGLPHLGFTGTPADAPPGYRPWYELSAPWQDEATAVFGHWSALGLLLGKRVLGLDTGCVWGGKLTGVRLEDHAVFQVESVEPTRVSREA